MKWQISDKDIEAAEELLLPQEAHFPDDARNVIRCWHSTDVAACPGSGKTTVLLAKLKLLADRMPFENGAGICVLSHTNVAVDEIKRKLSNYSDKILSYPNYVGTIQSFIDKFVTMPYIRNTFGRSVQVVDSLTYAQHMLDKMQKSSKYSKLNYMTKKNYEIGGEFSERINHTQALYLRNGALYIGRQKRALAGAGTPSSEQYLQLLADLLQNEGIIRYQDAYSFAKTAIDDLPTSYTDIFSSRFQYVFIDEYQDCNDIQRQAINSIFDPSKCVVFKIGDSDQAIYNQSEDTMTDWVPQDNYLPIMTSCRFGQEIANAICKLKKEEKSIVTYVGETGVKPVLFVFSPENIDKVIGEFISELETHHLYDENGIYKAIGAIKNENSAGLKIGSYWPKFDGSVKKKNEYNYWMLVEELAQELADGKLYKAEQIIRKLLCRVFHYIKILNPVSGKDFTTIAMKSSLDEKYRELYRQWIYEMSKLQYFDRKSIDQVLQQKINELLRIKNPTTVDVFTYLPSFFLDESTVVSQTENSEKNVLIDPIRGRKIVFDTIHAVKGETHDATLYLETYRQGSTDLKRILPYFGAGSLRKSALVDYSRKLAYVGMSRPKRLLCVAMQFETYEKSKDVFKNDWKIIDLRK